MVPVTGESCLQSWPVIRSGAGRDRWPGDTVAVGSGQSNEERTEHLRQTSILFFQSLSEVHSQ